ncbi:MAG: hypothetical protein QG669_47 [Patescibacteria group bacterium]|jgi:hypothetical protein|nr:hypothetical protein [Patescibacteria group bacterium]
MKLFKYILVIAVIGLMVYLIVTETKTNTIPVDSSPVVNVDDSNIEPREICYIWNTEAGDSATLRMKFSGVGGSNVQGQFDFVPAEKDKKTGPIQGIAGPLDQQMMARTAKVMWTASGEGVTNQEELYVIFGEGMASPGFGEMKDRGDGVYVYADPEKISYDLNLQQTDCGDDAVMAQ